MEDEIQRLISDLANNDMSRAIALCAGSLVGLLEFSVNENGGDHKKQITLEGGSRKITIHESTE